MRAPERIFHTKTSVKPWSSGPGRRCSWVWWVRGVDLPDRGERVAESQPESTCRAIRCYRQTTQARLKTYQTRRRRQRERCCPKGILQHHQGSSEVRPARLAREQGLKANQCTIYSRRTYKHRCRLSHYRQLLAIPSDHMTAATSSGGTPGAREELDWQRCVGGRPWHCFADSSRSSRTVLRCISPESSDLGTVDAVVVLPGLMEIEPAVRILRRAWSLSIPSWRWYPEELLLG